jgi:hypothetical protein
MFNPHDLVPLAQAIGACLSATQLRRPSIKLPLKTSLNETCAAHFVGPGMPEEECAGQRHARILTVAAYLQQTPRQSRGAGLCRLAHRQASGEKNRPASCSHSGPCRHRAGPLGASQGATSRRVSSVERHNSATRHGNTLYANLRGTSRKIPRASQFCHSDHSQDADRR